MAENTELAERINSIVSQVTSLIAIYGKPGADSAAAGREVEQILNEALTPSAAWTAAKPMQPGEHYAGHVCVAAGTSDDDVFKPLTVGEVLEKLRDPVTKAAIILRARTLLCDLSEPFITTPDAMDEMLEGIADIIARRDVATRDVTNAAYGLAVLCASGAKVNPNWMAKFNKAFPKQAKAKREKALAELTALSQEMGMYDDDEPNPLIKHDARPDPLAVTKRLLR